MAISALQSTKITTFSERNTGDEKTHRRLLGESVGPSKKTERRP
jgi:hypothetical protein